VPQLPESSDNYQSTLDALVERVRTARARALRSVNQELVLLYWDIGQEILERQQREGWGARVVDRLARDLRSLFPDMGMSARNLKYMRAFAAAWPSDQEVPRPVAQIPWGHIRILLDKLDDADMRLWYAAKAAEHGWTRDVLVHQIEGALHLRAGKGLTNFDRALPSPQSELAQQASRNPYETVVEYALRDVKTPIQVSEYRTQPLPEPLRHELPATAEIEAVLRALPMPRVWAKDARERSEY
jgi:predicted nuclease of restriction endonuclease-like (RecB) superfamily